MRIQLLELGCYLSGTSSTSRAIGTGAHSFVLAKETLYGGKGKPPPGLTSIVGLAMRASADAENFMEGTLTAYDPVTRTVTLDISAVTGTGTHGAWLIGGATTLRYASGEGYNQPTAPDYYWPRTMQPFWLRRTAFSPDKVGGEIRVGAGEAILANADGRLDALRHYAFGGRTAVLKTIDDAAAFGTAETEISAVIDQPVHQWGDETPSQIVLRLYDRLEDLRKPVQTNRYAGTNTGSPLAGVEGGDDIKGKVKPLVVCQALDAPGECVNRDRLIYQWHDGAVHSLVVYVGGKLLTAGTPYASQAEMEANAPSAGHYRVWLAGGMARLGEGATGPVTAEVVVEATAAARTTSQAMKRVATRSNGMPEGDVVAADVTALDAASDAEVQLFVNQEGTTILDCLNALAPGAGASFGIDALNRLRMKQLAAPGGSPAVTLRKLGGDAVGDATTVDTIRVSRKVNGERSLSVPVCRVVVHFRKCWTVQPSGFDETIDEARKAFIGKEWREAVAESALVKLKHPNARELHIHSPLIDEAAAQAEADRVLVLFGAERDLLEAHVKWSPALASLVDIGSVVELVDSRYGYDEGETLLVVEHERDAAKDSAILGLWG